ncbi:LysR family transcriptional regulator [Planktotalea sp.]|uniref:LysR family transcriptional regulator n=1 Tax=Planktotalea sp. TaxID=2029877 RepID=UPI00329A504F
MIEWNDFPVILAIARGKSLYRAAQSLDVAVSTVMRRVEQIESRAGLPLFRKTDAGYVPPPAGQALILRAVDMEKMAARAENALKSERSKAQGKIRISASEIIAPFFVARHLPALQDACPDHEIILTVTNQSPSQTSEVFDISLWPSTPSNEDLFGRKLTDLKWAQFGAFATSGQHTTSMVQLFGRDGAEKVNASHRKPPSAAKPSVSANSLITAAALAASGRAIAHLPFILGASWQGLKPLTPAENHQIGELWAIYRKADTQTPHIRALVDALAAAARADAQLFLGEPRS